ncbi:MAG TPA: DNA translocase FtsK [Verrucomicrobia bacterium]|nr:DNA translocase FtsK [Verrucomicrobiales bacterium]HIL54163.1 DNA translocase FtsK [Verrucomicrobiota bacterium]
MANIKRKRRKEFELSNSHLLSLGLIGFGFLYILSLISFSIDDLPAWVPFSHTVNPRRPAINFLGPPGATWAGMSFYTIGVTSYLIPAIMIWFGAARLIKKVQISKMGLIGFGILLVSGCCLMHYQKWFLQSGSFHISGTGGIIGEYVGKNMKDMTGAVGSFLIMSTAYCAAALLITRVYPGQILQAFIASYKSLKKWREHRIYSKANENDRLLIQKKKLEKEQRRIEKKIGKTIQLNQKEQSKEITKKETKVDPPLQEDSLDNTLPAEDANLETAEEIVIAEPKIYDASVRFAEEAKERKPSIAEVLAANKSAVNRVNGSEFSAPKEVEFPGYKLPDIDLLNYESQSERKPTDKNLLIQTQKTIIETLDNFNVNVSAGDITRGPTVTRYEIYPNKGLRVNRITALEADIARATKAERINILAPIPGRDTVGIEIANNEKVTVGLRELFEDSEFTDPQHKIPIALGKDVYGKTVIADLAKMPHLLVAGATGAGKSVCINGIIASMLYRFTPDELRFIMIDPKVVEMQVYNDLPHQIVPVVTDSKKVLLALRWVVNEMERRYQLFAKLNLRSFDAFNNREQNDGPESDQDKFFDTNGQSKLDFDPNKEPTKDADSEEDGEWEYEYEEVEVEVEYEEGEKDGEWNEVDSEDSKPQTHSEDILGDHSTNTAGVSKEEHLRNKEIVDSVDSADEEKIPERLPYIVVIIDELADLMQTAPADVEQAIARIAQKARAAGIHLIIATQTPRADIVTGIIKANIPSRIAFQVSSSLDSRVILDNKGAEKLVGKGDMLYLPPGSAQLQRAQGALITDKECVSIVDFCSEQASPIFAQEIEDSMNGKSEEDDEVSEEDEEIIEKCLEVIQVERRASTSLLQRRLRLGYTRAARMMDILEMRGIIGPGDGAKPREILVDLAN